MRNHNQWHSATVREHRDLSPQVREFEIRPEHGIRPWSVGSHLKLRVEIDGREETRHYSLVGLPDAPGADEVYRIAVRRAEPGRGGSRFLWNLETGNELLIGEPNNHFEIGLHATDTLLVAGGIGITPILGMALLLARKGARLRMLYAARTASELIYADALRAQLGDALHTFCSDRGERIDLDAQIRALPPHAQMALCGPAGSAGCGTRRLGARRPRGRRPALRDLRQQRHARGRGLLGRTAAPRPALRGARRSRAARHAGRERRGHACRIAAAANAGCARWTSSPCRARSTTATSSSARRRSSSNQRLCACVSRVSGGGVVLDSAFRPDE